MKRRWLRGLPVAGAMALTLLASPAGAGTFSIWQVVPTPNPGADQVSNTYFTGVSASSAADAWGVGINEINAFRHPLAEHWNGATWQALRVSAPATGQSWFNGVVALSPTNAWAVGEITNPQANNQDQRTLIEHWDGQRWTIVPSPNPAVGVNAADVLESVAGVGPSDLWAAGWDLDPRTNTISMLFEHFDGTSWQVVAAPPGGAQFARAIHAVASNDVWAVGNEGIDARTLAAHWDGHSWKIVPTPNLLDGRAPQDFLTGVTSTGSKDVWASGYEDNVNQMNFAKPYMLHWNGQAWSLVLVPNLGGEGSRLRATTALAANDVWVVGTIQELNGSILTLTEQFDGATWKVVSSPNPGKVGDLFLNNLNAVASPGPGTVFTVGSKEITGQCCLRTLALHTARG